MNIKVLHIIDTLSSGGAENRLLNDLRYLNNGEVSNIVCHIFKSCELKEEVLKMKIPVCSLELERPSVFIKAVIRLANIVKYYKPDIIHTQLFVSDVYGRIIGKLFRIPVVSTIQSSVYEPGIEYFHSPKRRLLDSLTGKLCNSRFIAVSDFVKNSSIKRLGFKKEKIEVIYNYIDTAKVNISEERILLRRQFDINENDIILISIGKFNPPKGHRFLFEAVSYITKQCKSVKLLVIGDGYLKEKLLGLKDNLGLNGHIRFLGERKDIFELLFLSDIFVFPSLSEGLPVSLLEAMFMKKPCVAFNLGPMAEVIEDGKTGILVEPKNSKALAEAILALIEDKEKATALGIAARETVLNKFSVKDNVNKLAALYRNILNNNEK